MVVNLEKEIVFQNTVWFFIRMTKREKVKIISPFSGVTF